MIVNFRQREKLKEILQWEEELETQIEKEEKYQRENIQNENKRDKEQSLRRNYLKFVISYHIILWRLTPSYKQKYVARNLNQLYVESL